MAWLSRNNLTPSDYLIADFLNSLANDDRNWGGDVNGGGYKLTNVILSGAGGFQNVLSPMEIVPGSDSMSRVQLDQLVAAVPTARWSLQKNATAEGGANAGSDFQIVRYNDAGAVLSPSLTVLRSSGFVGIGTATPGGQLSLGTAVSDYRLLIYDASPVFYGFGVRANQWMQYCAAAAAMTFGQMNGATFTERMRIDSAGNVGIGTATVPIMPALAGRRYLTIKGSAEAGLVELAGSFPDADATVCGILTFTDDLNSQADKRVIQIAGFRDGVTPLNRGGALAFQTRADGAAAVTERMRLTAAGNVGINSAAPLAQLEVGGFLRILPTLQAAPTSGLGLEIYVPQTLDYARMLCFDRSGTGYRSFQIGTNNGQQLLLNKNGNVSIGDPGVAGCFLGVGTPSPTYRLHVYGLGAAESSGNIFTPSLNTNNSIFIQDSSVAVFSGGAIVFGSANFSYAAIRTVYVNGTGFGQANIAFYTRPNAGTEALTLAVQISPFGVVYNPTMPLSNPGAGTKALWADPADGYRVKFAV